MNKSNANAQVKRPQGTEPAEHFVGFASPWLKDVWKVLDSDCWYRNTCPYQTKMVFDEQCLDGKWMRFYLAKVLTFNYSITWLYCFSFENSPVCFQHKMPRGVFSGVTTRNWTRHFDCWATLLLTFPGSGSWCPDQTWTLKERILCFPHQDDVLWLPNS